MVHQLLPLGFGQLVVSRRDAVTRDQLALAARTGLDIASAVVQLAALGVAVMATLIRNTKRILRILKSDPLVIPDLNADPQRDHRFRAARRFQHLSIAMAAYRHHAPPLVVSGGSPTEKLEFPRRPTKNNVSVTNVVSDWS
jgi:hypothetical protein